MTEDTRTSVEGTRHFDRGFALARWALGGAVLVAACSGSLKPGGDPGTAAVGGDAGTTGSAGVSGDAGAAAPGDAGYGYGGTYGGDAGTSGTCSFPFNGPGCPPGNCAAGTGNCGTSGGTGGSAGSGSSTGSAGTVGSTSLPACVDGAPSFGVCFVSDADVLPLPTPVFNDKGTSTTGAATIVDVGTGAAPASCEDARVFGARGTSDWWFQAKAANNRVWTIGVRGLGNVPLVHKTDAVTLNLNWRGYGPGVGVGNPYGELQLQDAADAPLLWASSDKNTMSWVALAAGPAECDVTAVCNGDRHAVLANVNGSTATVPSFGSAYLGGFFLAVGQSVNSLGMLPGQCPDYYPPPFEAAAAKVPVSGP